MAFFHDYRGDAHLEQDNFATLRVTVVMDRKHEEVAYQMIQEEHPQLETQIREAIASILGPQFTLANVAYSFGSIELLIAIGAATFGTYSAFSKYKNFVESMTLLTRQVRDIVNRFFERRQHPPLSVTTGWLPGPTMMQRALQLPTSPEPPLGFWPVLWYLIISHAALLLVVLWRIIRVP